MQNNKQTKAILQNKQVTKQHWATARKQPSKQIQEELKT